MDDPCYPSTSSDRSNPNTFSDPSNLSTFNDPCNPSTFSDRSILSTFNDPCNPSTFSDRSNLSNFNDPCNPSISNNMYFYSSFSLPQTHPLWHATQAFTTEDKSYIKRPMNSFMVWSAERRKELAKKKSNLHNSNISKQLGEEWKNLPPETKQIFIDKAHQLREEHRKQFPEYKYFPRKKDSKTESDPNNSEPTVPTNQPTPYSGYVNNCPCGLPLPPNVWHPAMTNPPPLPLMVPYCSHVMSQPTHYMPPYSCNNPYHKYM